MLFTAVKVIIDLFTTLGKVIVFVFTGDSVKIVKDTWNGVVKFFGDVWKGIKKPFENADKWFGGKFGLVATSIMRAFSNGGVIFKNITNGIAKIFGKIANSLIGGINNVIKDPFTTVNNAIKAIKNFEFLGLMPFKSLSTISIPKIPLLSFWNGGFVPQNIGQLFIANEPGNPELVGNIGGRTAVVNNNMIIEAIEGAMTNAIIKGFRQVRIEREDGTIIIENYYDGQLIERKMIEADEAHRRKTGKPLFGY
jgi:hypothetical protein